MRVGFFAALVDKIQHAYGWDDDTVLDLTLRRAVQIRESITQREEFDRWEHRRNLEWQTRHLASATVLSSMMDSEAKEKLIKAFSEISFDGKSSDTSKKTKKVRKNYRTVDGKELTASELKDYSYEEIDRSSFERATVEHARSKNSGAGLNDMLGSFTR